MQASEKVIEVAGSAIMSSLNFYDTGGGCMVTTQQVDEAVFVVGQDDFTIATYSLAEWIGVADQAEPPVINCHDAVETWEVLQALREDCYQWQCGNCDAWLFTTNRPRIGVLGCSTCGDGGVDFRHADRNI